MKNWIKMIKPSVPLAGELISYRDTIYLVKTTDVNNHGFKMRILKKTGLTWHKKTSVSQGHWLAYTMPMGRFCWDLTGGPDRGSHSEMIACFPAPTPLEHHFVLRLWRPDLQLWPAPGLLKDEWANQVGHQNILMYVYSCIQKNVSMEINLENVISC